MTKKYNKQLKFIILEAIKEAGLGQNAMFLNPGTPEWEELQKVLSGLNLPPRSTPTKVSGSPFKKPEPKPVENLPAQQSRHPVKMFSPEEVDVIRKAVEILRNKDK
jgi:hypothetical protein